MIKYAEIVDSKVVNIVIATEATVSTMPGTFIKVDTALNKDDCSIGSLYNKEINAFARQKPYPSWTLDEETYAWMPPSPKPTEGISYWDEETTTWVAITPVDIELENPVE